MPSQKRERKRGSRLVKLEQQREAQRRAARRRTVIRSAVIGVLVLGIAGIVSFAGGSDSGAKKVDAGDSTSTTAGERPAASYGDTPCPPEEPTGDKKQKFESAFEKCLEEGVDYTAVVKTDIGEYTVDLLEEQAPVTVNNFVALARNRYYEETVFHRVLKGFVVQGGDPEGTGSGGPGYSVADELPEEGAYEIGSLAMANSGPDTNGSQFFVITGERGAQLPPSYSLFGKVTEGLDVVKAIEADGVENDGEPLPKTHRILSVTIVEK